jgi:hypothetical protein
MPNRREVPLFVAKVDVVEIKYADTVASLVTYKYYRVYIVGVALHRWKD